MIVYSKQLFFYILERYPDIIEEVYLSKDIEPKLFSQIKRATNAPILKPDTKKAQALAKGNNHQGFLLKINEQFFAPFQTLALDKCKFILVLANITVVGNIGNIIRSAYSLGVDGIILSGIKNLSVATIIRTSVGAFFELPVVSFKDTLDVLSRLQEQKFSLYGAVLKGKDLSAEPVKEEKVALIMGNEHEGLTPKVIRKIDHPVSIVMQNNFDSLNVSSATAILTYTLQNKMRANRGHHGQ